jgi:hypothetical protein
MTELNNFGVDSWQDVDNMLSPASSRTLPNAAPNFQTNHMNNDIFGGHHSQWPQQSIQPGSSFTGRLNCAAEMKNRYAPDSDESSEISEPDTNLLDTQPWESVQISSVSAVEASDSTDADFLWLENNDELDDTFIQVTRTSNASNRRELTGQQSRRPFMNQILRNETSITRKLKACVRCRMQKIRVRRLNQIDDHLSKLSKCQIDENNPSGECKTCQSVSKQRLYTLPCARYKLTECILYRTGKAPGLEFTFRWPTMKLKDITEWADPEVRTISIQSDVCPVAFDVNVRRFIPDKRDSRKRGWMAGNVKKFTETTPFAIVNMTSALKDMKNYVDVNVFECVDHFIQNTDTLVRETYDFARKHMERHKVSHFSESLFVFMELMISE